ncbi:hypothetical protein JCM4814A_17290 [Streptomyces phaeofaciens JCM 4814]|uniref:AB hydrolase-1 domain-containing protein n=1 Tax=Streptomyces phaeofaciens TaxID=68254 RepID=A0A918HA78_9ACTN|nr:alpha/beta fold hydrolase [Streptomyces phaeofaciens]GGT49223.1 hypothetical protein GCM10010226_28070 [Streptomyces phaeofaciens]
MRAECRVGGAPVVLLHGFPQTHLMWRHVAADLATDRTVICPDLRGYGASDKPAETGPEVYSKRTMAGDVVRLAAELGHDRFTLAGHDRGALVAFRAAMDHPETVSRALFLDVLPTLDIVGRPARGLCRRRLPPLPDGPDPRPARGDDPGDRRPLLRLLPRCGARGPTIWSTAPSPAVTSWPRRTPS